MDDNNDESKGGAARASTSGSPLPSEDRMMDLAKIYHLLAQDLVQWQQQHGSPVPPSPNDTPVIYQLHAFVTEHREQANDPDQQSDLRAQMDELVSNLGGPSGFEWSEAEVEDLEHLMLEGWAADLAPYGKPPAAGLRILFW